MCRRVAESRSRLVVGLLYGHGCVAPMKVIVAEGSVTILYPPTNRER